MSNKTPFIKKLGKIKITNLDTQAPAAQAAKTAKTAKTAKAKAKAKPAKKNTTQKLKFSINRNEANLSLKEMYDDIIRVDDVPDEKQLRNFEIIKSNQEREQLTTENNKYDYLYPNLYDPDFNIKIAERKEFNDTRYDGKIYDVEKQAEILCNADYELAPHQQFVRNFLSFETPYNSLLLYHGLGSGKTCSAISVSEEMRDYLNQMGISQRVIVVASPNVQENFKLQLFDERKLELIDGLWNLRACTGNKFLKEINPMNMKGLSKEKVIRQIRRIINNAYLFMGYIEFANYISKKSQIDSDIKGVKNRNIIMKKKLKRIFNNRLIIIDEVHNIRITDDNKDKRVAKELLKLVESVDNLRLLFLSATPMYNSYKEIIWLVNLMNINDKRPGITVDNVFNKDGGFKLSEDGEEIGKELLERKATGYISFVRGENPYTFPYRIWPDEFAISHTFKENEFPLEQLNGKRIIQNLEKVSVYLTNIGSYQQQGYNYIIEQLKSGNLGPAGKNTPSFENMESFGYVLLQRPLEALNIIYPSKKFDEILGKNDGKSKIDISKMVGKEGLSRIIKYKETYSPPSRKDFEYKTNEFGRIFSPEIIGKYSGKIKNICDNIMNSTGVVLVYSQYIDGGLVPMALALEELGFTRAGMVSSLFKTAPTEQIDALTYKSKSDVEIGKFNSASYIMITGDKTLSPDNVKDLELVTNINNKEGAKVKVILISQAGSEGLDFKFIRQVHVLEPWYNMNRIEQILGRAVRTCSHKNLPFKQRNVEIYLHGSLMENKTEEAADLYIYRLAELKALQIGLVSRVLKEISVDCLLNYEQVGFTVDKINQIVKQELSSGKEILYAIGDRPFTSTCDYMSNCSYTCKPNKTITESDIKLDTYNESFIMMNTDKIIQRIRNLFKDKYFYRKAELISMINIVKSYPLVQINAALNQLVEDKNEFISDKYGRLGSLVNIGDLYLFQPLELDDKHISVYDRSVPIEYKRPVLSFEINEQFEYPSIIPVKIIKKKGETETSSEDKKILAIIANIQNSYDTALAAAPAAAAAADELASKNIDEWYKSANSAIKIMIGEGIDKKILSKLVIDHMCDVLLFNDKLNLINYFEKQKELKLNKTLAGVKKYFTDKIIKHKNLSGILLQNEGNKQLITLSSGDKEWKLAEPEDYQDLAQQIATTAARFIPVKNKINDIVGFTTNFKKEYMVFKVKEMSKRRNKGARCDQSQKGEALLILNKILGENKYDKESKMGRVEICVLQELYLRLFDMENKNKKAWYLSPSEAVLINIEKL